MDIEDKKSHIDFYKHVSSLSLVTFGGCITLIGVFESYTWYLLVACYLALTATLQSLYAVKVIVSENRIPYTKPGPFSRKLSIFIPYRILMVSLFIVAIVVAQAVSSTNKKEVEPLINSSEPSKSKAK
jgi:hypothetical protein